MPHRPSWFRNDEVLTSAAPTCGINKDGLDQFVVDLATGDRSTVDIDDALHDDVERVFSGASSETLSYVGLRTVLDQWRAVPTYYDESKLEEFHRYLSQHLPGWVRRR